MVGSCSDGLADYLSGASEETVYKHACFRVKPQPATKRQLPAPKADLVEPSMLSSASQSSASIASPQAIGDAPTRDVISESKRPVPESKGVDSVAARSFAGAVPDKADAKINTAMLQPSSTTNSSIRLQHASADAAATVTQHRLDLVRANATTFENTSIGIDRKAAFPSKVAAAVKPPAGASRLASPKIVNKPLGSLETKTVKAVIAQPGQLAAVRPRSASGLLTKQIAAQSSSSHIVSSSRFLTSGRQRSKQRSNAVHVNHASPAASGGRKNLSASALKPTTPRSTFNQPTSLNSCSRRRMSASNLDLRRLVLPLVECEHPTANWRVWLNSDVVSSHESRDPANITIGTLYFFLIFVHSKRQREIAVSKTFEPPGYATCKTISTKIAIVCT